MKPSLVWRSRALTLMLIVVGGITTAVCIDTFNGGGALPLWFFAAGCLIFVAAHLGVRSLAARVSGVRGYALDAVMGIPFGMLFVAQKLALPVVQWGWPTILNIVFLGFFAFFISDYSDRRTPQKNTPAIPAAGTPGRAQTQ